jgi:two-component system, OmpR family, sensor histidine kinase ResE
MFLDQRIEQINAPLDATSWRQVIETAADIIYVLSPDGTILDANPRFCRVFKQPREKVVGSRIVTHLDRDQVALTERLLREIVERKSSERSTRSWQLAGSEGQTFEVMETPLIREGKVWAIAGIGREVTQEIVLEHKLWDTVESRQSAVDFALRTSLGLIKGYIYTLGQNAGMNDHRRARYVKIIEEEIDHLAKIIEDLLDVRRIESGDLELPLAIIDLNDCVHGVFEECEADAERRQIQLVANLPDKANPLSLPRDALHRVLFNLVQNAILHTLHSGVVTVDVHDQEAYVEFAVKDNGTGISESEVPYIFDKYFRGKDATASTVQGTGLGLAITRMLLSAMGGKIWVTSKVGVGSEFHVVLPRRPVGLDEVVETQPWKPASAMPRAASSV